ncbi:MAG: hypothetical protein Q8M96_04690, partial [Rubrivivax sp.]|nr:hypothetical protein [Rubrivivax sp.]
VSAKFSGIPADPPVGIPSLESLTCAAIFNFRAQCGSAQRTILDWPSPRRGGALAFHAWTGPAAGVPLRKKPPCHALSANTPGAGIDVQTKYH